MKTVELSNIRKSLAQCVKDLNNGVLVLTSDGKPVAALVSLKHVDMETLALSMNAEFAEILRKAKAEFERGETFSLEEMKRECLAS